MTCIIFEATKATQLTLNYRLILKATNVFISKFGLSEKHTKFEKNLPRGFDKSADLLSKLQNHVGRFF